MRSLDFRMLDALKGHVPQKAHAPGHVRSAVLIPVLSSPEGDRLLYTKRSNRVESHRGQICFPGGKWSERDDDLQSTALRESWEEVAIVPGDVEILGRLDDQVTLSGFVITPIVGRLQWPYPLRPNPDEIARLITVSLAELLRAQVFHLEPPPEPEGRNLQAYSFESAGEPIWGVTARITKQFIDIVAGGSMSIA